MPRCRRSSRDVLVSSGSGRGVTRGYVFGLVGAAVVGAFALLLALWGLLAWATDREPISTPGVGLGAASVMFVCCLLLLAWGTWAQSILLLRGRRTPSWAHIITVGLGAYLIWCVVGLAFGLHVEDSWASPFAGLIAMVWALAAFTAWAVLVRRVFTDRPVPKWPWEKRGEPGPDWAHTGEDPWLGDVGGDRDESSPDDDDRGDEGPSSGGTR